jgi:hypothetical protein
MAGPFERDGIAVFSLTEKAGGTDMDAARRATTRAALRETFDAASVWNNGAMENAGIITFRDTMLLGSEELLDDAPQAISVETGQAIRAMSPLRYRRGWTRF